MDLDYSLGGGKTGLDLLHWLHENGKNPERLNIHSSNERGRKQMAEYAGTNWPGTQITMKRL